MRKLVAFAIVIMIALLAMPTARADDRLQPNEVEYMAQYGNDLCLAIEGDPTPQNVFHIGEDIINDGFDPESAADIINYTVAIYCPNWGPLLDETSRVYGEKGPIKRAL